MNTLEFAAYELKRYSAAMGIAPQITFTVDVDQFDTTHFWRFDAQYDDAFKIEVKDGIGSIVATNERSVLLGVYHFLKCQGCRFLRPGKDGEYIPMVDQVKDVSETCYAHTRHRGTTDGGCHSDALGAEGMLAYIDWLPKVMMNTFFIELPDYYEDMKARYQHTENPYREAQNFTYEQYQTYDKWIAEETQKRGLLRHGAGHGWTLAQMEGITDTSRNVTDQVCTKPEILAEIDGERKLFNGKPVYTNLCYSRPDVRKKFAEAVYAYAEAHPEVDFVHVWLADYFNNFCECENCRKLAQSDWFVMILNEIDEVFTAHGSDRKIVFLIYFELAYAPIRERIKNEDRFVMMFAPFGRDFTKRYKDCKEIPHEPAPLNEFKWEYMDMGLYLYQLRKWKEIFKGDSFVFDYCIYDTACHTEVTNVGYAPIHYEDCTELSNYGLNGRIECGSISAMTPTSILLYSMAHGMFYGKTDFDAIEKDYFEAAYGKEQQVLPFLQAMSGVLPSDYMRCKTQELTEEEKARLQDGPERVRKFRQEFSGYMPMDAVQRQNCRYFKEYLDLLELILKIIKAKANGCAEEELEEYIEKFRHVLFYNAAIMPLYVGTDLSLLHLRSAFRNKKESTGF